MDFVSLLFDFTLWSERELQSGCLVRL